jgi:anti-sigma-K factor RskA
MDGIVGFFTSVAESVRYDGKVTWRTWTVASVAIVAVMVTLVALMLVFQNTEIGRLFDSRRWF